jgi:nicotinate-nucleotide adenylyltransferase
MAENRRIALFGGTFDPVHLGHVHLAQLAKEKLRLNEVRFLPCRISPHKSGTMPTSPRDRIKMLRLATRDLPWAVVDEFETMREGPSYSWQTAEAMKARFPDARLFWIMGTDQWKALPDWAKPERLAACVEFIVFARGEPPLPQKGCVLHAVEGAHPASATAIRGAIRAGEKAHPWLHPEVSRWIAEHGLYRD